MYFLSSRLSSGKEYIYRNGAGVAERPLLSPNLGIRRLEGRAIFVLSKLRNQIRGVGCRIVLALSKLILPRGRVESRAALALSKLRNLRGRVEGSAPLLSLSKLRHPRGGVEGWENPGFLIFTNGQYTVCENSCAMLMAKYDGGV